MSQPNPTTINDLILSGFKIIEFGFADKGIEVKGWNKKNYSGHLTKDYQHHPFKNYGICHAYSGTMALDIDDVVQATDILSKVGIDLHALLNADDAVQIISGKPNKAKLLYRTPFPLSSKKVRYKDGSSTHDIIDFRCATSEGLTVQDVLPPSTHPETMGRYQWGGKGNPAKPPMIPASLLGYWSSLLKVVERTEPVKPSDATWDHIEDALSYLNPDCCREEWLHIGMALHHQASGTGECEYALDVWDKWSSGSKMGKYDGYKGLLPQWRSFKTTRDDAVTINTLFHYATLQGYVPSRRDVSHLFKPVEELMSPVLPAWLTGHAPDNVQVDDASYLFESLPYVQIDFDISDLFDSTLPTWLFVKPQALPAWLTGYAPDNVQVEYDVSDLFEPLLPSWASMPLFRKDSGISESSDERRQNPESTIHLPAFLTGNQSTRDTQLPDRLTDLPDVPSWLSASQGCPTTLTKDQPTRQVFESLTVKDIVSVGKPKPPSLSPTMLPDDLWSAAHVIAGQQGSDPAVAVAAILSCVSGVADSRVGLELRDGFVVPPTVWSMVIGDPSVKKSPVTTPIVKLIDELIQVPEVKVYEEKKREYDVEKRFHDKAVEAYMKRRSDTLLDNSDPIRKMPYKEPEAPKGRPTLVLRDSTSATLVRTAIASPKGMLHYKDDGADWLAGLASMQGYESRSVWIASFDGGSYTQDRVGQGFAHADNLNVAQLVNVQPRQLMPHLHALGDGFIHRFIPFLATHHPEDKTIPRGAVSATLKSLGERFTSIRHAKSPAKYELSDAARDLFESFRESMDERVRLLSSDRDTSPLFVEALGKMVGYAGRLAYVFHLFTHLGYHTTVSLATLRQAIRFILDFVIPSFQVMYCSNHELNAVEASVMDHVLHVASSGKGTLTASDVELWIKTDDNLMKLLEGKQARLQWWIESALITFQRRGFLAPLPKVNARDRLSYQINPCVGTLASRCFATRTLNEKRLTALTDRFGS